MTGNKSDTKISRDLRVPGWLAKWPIIGILMFLVGSLMFGALAYNVWTRGPLLQWDVPITTELHNEAVKEPPRIIELLLFGFYVGKELVQVFTVILGLYFLHKRFWRELAMLLVGLGGGALIWYYLIGIFNRHRPDAQIGIVVTDPSFPSGHVITAVLFYGLLAYLFVPKMPSLFWKWVVVIASILTVLYIGFSRLFLGGHYLTDLLAGYALGIAWAGLVYTLIERISMGRMSSSR
ncbi:MAG TPA: phosphatase PAP2 family protein [Anaerolineales bacterium]|nr:phosphatase PAP2 family protein [Anaerolineales bacterium]